MTVTTQLTRALAWKQEARMQLAILDGLGRDPSVGRDIAFDAYSDALEKRRSIIQTEWDIRKMERQYTHTSRAVVQAQVAA